MNAWLSGQANYVKVCISPKLARQLGSNGSSKHPVVVLLRQLIKDALGGEPTSWRWEIEGENILIGAAVQYSAEW